jgi:hypothetical protein
MFPVTVLREATHRATILPPPWKCIVQGVTGTRHECCQPERRKRSACSSLLLRVIWRIAHLACDFGPELPGKGKRLMLRAIPLALQGRGPWQRAAMRLSSPGQRLAFSCRSSSPLQHVVFKRYVILVRRLEIPNWQQRASGNKRRSGKHKEEVVPSVVFAYVDHEVR